MKSPSTTLIRSALAVTVGLLLVFHGSFAAAARPSAAHAQSSKSKLPKARKKNPADTNRPRPPAADLDGSEARDTLESALENYETMLAVIANNIANADTPGFKRSLAIVEDLGYRQEGLPGVQDSLRQLFARRVFHRIGQPDRGHGNRLPTGQIEVERSRTGPCH